MSANKLLNKFFKQIVKNFPTCNMKNAFYDISGSGLHLLRSRAFPFKIVPYHKNIGDMDFISYATFLSKYVKKKKKQVRVYLASLYVLSRRAYIKNIIKPKIIISTTR